MGQVVVPELTSSRRQGLELRDTWQRQSSPQQGSEVQVRGTHGSAGAHLCSEVRSGAEGHVAATEFSSARSKIRPRCSDPPLSVMEAPKEQTRPTDT
jgi:hypothetical protein